MKVFSNYLDDAGLYILYKAFKLKDKWVKIPWF